MFVCVHAIAHIWKSENSWELILFFHLVAVGNQTQVVRLSSKWPYPLRHLDNPLFSFYNMFLISVYSSVIYWLFYHTFIMTLGVIFKKGSTNSVPWIFFICKSFKFYLCLVICFYFYIWCKLKVYSFVHMNVLFPEHYAENYSYSINWSLVSSSDQPFFSVSIFSVKVFVGID